MSWSTYIEYPNIVTWQFLISCSCGFNATQHFLYLVICQPRQRILLDFICWTASYGQLFWFSPSSSSIGNLSAWAAAATAGFPNSSSFSASVPSSTLVLPTRRATNKFITSASIMAKFSTIIVPDLLSHRSYVSTSKHNDKSSCSLGSIFPTVHQTLVVFFLDHHIEDSVQGRQWVGVKIWLLIDEYRSSILETHEELMGLLPLIFLGKFLSCFTLATITWTIWLWVMVFKFDS